MKKLLTLTVLLVLSNPLVAQDKKSKKATGKQKVIYKYRKYEKFDLGNLEIKGSIVAPGDLSVKERSRRTFSRDLYDRDNFNREVIEDIRNLR